MKENKITVRFSDEELLEIKKRAKQKDIKVATLIRECALNAITNDELLSGKDELKQFIISTVEEANDKKLGRIISLLFRATSHIDVVKEQNNLFYRLVSGYYSLPKELDFYDRIPHIEHQITRYCEQLIEERDKENIINDNYRKKKD